MPTVNAPQQQQQQEETPSMPPAPREGEERQAERIDPALEAKLKKVDELLERTDNSNLGTENDLALQYVESEYSSLVKSSAPDLKGQLDQLQAQLKGGQLDANAIQKIQQFQQRMQAGEQPEPPAEVKQIGQGIETAKRVMTPGTVERSAMEMLDKKLLNEMPNELMRAFYKAAITEIHKYQNKK